MSVPNPSRCNESHTTAKSSTDIRGRRNFLFEPELACDVQTLTCEKDMPDESVRESMKEEMSSIG
jgi:hypothetical protein